MRYWLRVQSKQNRIKHRSLVDTILEQGRFLLKAVHDNRLKSFSDTRVEPFECHTNKYQKLFPACVKEKNDQVYRMLLTDLAAQVDTPFPHQLSQETSFNSASFFKSQNDKKKLSTTHPTNLSLSLSLSHTHTHTHTHNLVCVYVVQFNILVEKQHCLSPNV